MPHRHWLCQFPIHDRWRVWFRPIKHCMHVYQLQRESGRTNISSVIKSQRVSSVTRSQHTLGYQFLVKYCCYLKQSNNPGEKRISIFLHGKLKRNSNWASLTSYPATKYQSWEFIVTVQQYRNTIVSHTEVNTVRNCWQSTVTTTKLYWILLR